MTWSERYTEEDDFYLEKKLDVVRVKSMMNESCIFKNIQLLERISFAYNLTLEASQFSVPLNVMPVMQGGTRAHDEIENGYTRNSHNSSQVTSRLHTIFMNNKFTSVYYFSLLQRTHFIRIKDVCFHSFRNTTKKRKRQSHFLKRCGVLIVFL